MSDDFSRSIGKRIQERFAARGVRVDIPGIATEEELAAEAHARRRQALSELAAQADKDKTRTAELAAQRQAEAQQLQDKLRHLGMQTDDEHQEPNPAPNLALNSSALLNRAAGGTPHRTITTADLLRREIERLPDNN
jgi:hypothetical protein